MFNDCEKPAAAKDEECEGKALARQTQAEEKIDSRYNPNHINQKDLIELSLQSLHSSKLRQFLTWPYIVNVLPSSNCQRLMWISNCRRLLIMTCKGE